MYLKKVAKLNKLIVPKKENAMEDLYRRRYKSLFAEKLSQPWNIFDFDLIAIPHGSTVTFKSQKWRKRKQSS